MPNQPRTEIETEIEIGKAIQEVAWAAQELKRVSERMNRAKTAWEERPTPRNAKTYKDLCDEHKRLLDQCGRLFEPICNHFTLMIQRSVGSRINLLGTREDAEDVCSEVLHQRIWNNLHIWENLEPSDEPADTEQEGDNDGNDGITH